MGLFKCKSCGRVLSTNFLSMKHNLCKKCFIELEELYDKSGIHSYIRDNGLPENFTPEQLAEDLGLNTRNVVLLYELGFFERDIQVYSHSGKERREKLAGEISFEINKMRIRKRITQARETENKENKENKTPSRNSYSGGIYRRRRRF